MGANINPKNPTQTFLQKCQSLEGSEVDKINAVLDLVIQLIVQPTLVYEGKTFYGCDYEHPNWQCQATIDYRVEGKFMPIEEFVKLGFGDCRIVNGLVAFGLNYCGLDAAYSYKEIVAEQYDQLSGDILMSKDIDHATCIVQIEEKRYLVDGNYYVYNGHLLNKLVTGTVRESDPKDLPLGTSDLYRWRQTINSHSQTIDPHNNPQMRHIKKTNPFPNATITQKADTPYLALMSSKKEIISI